MKLHVLMILGLLFTSFIYAQERGIMISNTNLQKENFIEEGKRIRVKTKDGKKKNGRFYIVDDTSIRIRKHTILLDDIEKIKKNPLGLLVANTVVLLFPVAIPSFFLGLVASELVLVGVAGYGYGIGSLNILKGYKPDKGWNLEIRM
ncbi:hypothetical protein [uncultured Dokdonia sp.]|uniref:hypothetical protein n=1 Tax=uncultured Dokdonia sp. TaxID=575653 RepID=UPI00262B01AB|nr:hypothetical protein [uncultured Dokdonia sp.]